MMLYKLLANFFLYSDREGSTYQNLLIQEYLEILGKSIQCKPGSICEI